MREKNFFPNPLTDTGINKIIFYGASEFALRLVKQCENEDNIVRVVGIVDRSISSKGMFYKTIPLFSLSDFLELV